MSDAKGTERTVLFKGQPLHVSGDKLAAGDSLPDVILRTAELQDRSLHSFAERGPVVISVVPSLDTSVCSLQGRRFNELAAEHKDATVLVISRDLPFAQERWCDEHEAHAVIVLSDYYHRQFGEAFGTEVKELGLLARSVFVTDQSNTVRYVEYLEELTDEPNYEAAFEALSKL